MRSYNYEKYVADFLICVIMGIAITAGCSTVNDDGAAEAVEKMGFTDPVVENSSWFMPEYHGCGHKDWSYYNVRAINPQNQEVELLVCKGFLKGYTVRVN